MNEELKQALEKIEETLLTNKEYISSRIFWKSVDLLSTAFILENKLSRLDHIDCYPEKSQYSILTDSVIGYSRYCITTAMANIKYPLKYKDYCISVDHEAIHHEYFEAFNVCFENGGLAFTPRIEYVEAMYCVMHGYDTMEKILEKRKGEY